MTHYKTEGLLQAS